MFHRVRAFRAFRATVFAAGLGLGSAVVLVVPLAVSCLPDLRTDPPSGALDAARDVIDSPDVAPFCGDGVIDYGDGGEACDPGDGGVKGCTPKCTIECAGGFIDKAGGTDHCYLVAGTAVSDKAANDLCSARDAHVVTFGSDDERARVQAALAPDGIYWVGLGYDPTAGAYESAVPSEPGWKAGCTGCYARVSALGIFPKLRPDAASGQCVGDSNDAGSWFQLACFTPGVGPIITICEREPLGLSSVACDGGACVTIHETASSKRYVLGLNPVVAADAPGACAGGHLVVLDSREEREALMKEVARALGNPPVDTAVWIGLARADGGAWTWDDGQPLDAHPIPWGDKEPKATLGTARAYASLLADYDIELARSDDHAQTVRHPYLCEYAVAH